MDNSLTPAEAAHELSEMAEELPREEVLARLYELLASLEARAGLHPCPVAAERQLPAHAFRLGCCRDAARAAAA